MNFHVYASLALPLLLERIKQTFYSKKSKLKKTAPSTEIICVNLSNPWWKVIIFAHCKLKNNKNHTI